MNSSQCHDPAVDPQDLAQFFVLRANAGDVEGLVALHEPDAALADKDGKVAKGAKAIRHFYTALLADRPEFTAGEQRLVLLNGELALVSSRLTNGRITAEIAGWQPDGTWL